MCRLVLGTMRAPFSAIRTGIVPAGKVSPFVGDSILTVAGVLGRADGVAVVPPPPGPFPPPQAAPTSVRVIQGAVEQSNVRGVLEIGRMIEITRSYTQIASLLQQASDLRRSAIEKLADVPA